MFTRPLSFIGKSYPVLKFRRKMDDPVRHWIVVSYSKGVILAVEYDVYNDCPVIENAFIKTMKYKYLEELDSGLIYRDRFLLLDGNKRFGRLK